MDGSRFDDFARTFTVSRRSALKTLLRGAAAGAAAMLAPGIAGEAQGCAPLRRRCEADAECCSGVCDPASGQCACGDGAEECGRECIAAEQFLTDVSNCGSCRNRCRQAPECQLPACIDGVCGGLPDPDQIGQPCGRSGGSCGADGVCACPPDQPTACRTGCVDTATDVSNCGVCEHRCRAARNGAAVCVAGVCGTVCNDGFDSCGEGCCEQGRDCCNGRCCRPNECCSAEGCVRCRCVIGIESFDAGEINPDNACQFCDPTRHVDDWTTAQDGSFCGEGRICCNAECCSPSECCDGVQCTVDACPDQCEIEGQPFESGEHNPANDCQVCKPEADRFNWTIVDDQDTCGGVPGRVCCNAACCSPTECCGETGCEECGPHCRIGGEDIDEDTVNPERPCEICKPAVNVNDWSPADNGAACGDNAVCCDGDCCSAGLCCRDGVCGDCQCEIGNGTFERNDKNPFNACEICNPDQSRDDWSPGPPNSDCGLTGGRNCCGGECCPEGECCNNIGECEPCPCFISGDPVVPGGVNPRNTCEICDPDKDRNNWTVLGDREACGNEFDDRVCCAGDCCEQGQCCENGRCQDCGCEIDGHPVDRDRVNDANVCEICDPGRARFAWSPVLGEKACENGGSCCGGDCCPADQCCLLDACGECLCHIGDDNVPPDTANPVNACQICKPDENPFDWTVLIDKTPCIDLPGQICCGGNCCEPGQCCTDGACQSCACVIDGVGFDAGEINPDNLCELCDPTRSTTAWTPVDNGVACGEHQVCCAGTCCGIGGCCTEIGTCLACQCIIDGATIQPGATNSANGCEVCDPLVSTTAWSPAIDDSPCADQFGQVCCAGVCCPAGQCCHPEDQTCGPCRCTIAGVEFDDGDFNPANDCQVCTPALSSTDWSSVPDNAPCGDHPGRVCCRDACCTDGNCCHSEEGACGSGPCVCTIGEEEIAEGEPNPENACQQCDPAENPDDWTPVPDSSACGLNSDQLCCAGTCCPAGDCCTPDGCRACGCTIDGQSFAEGAINPDNDCEICDPAVSATDWSAPSEPTSCANNEGACCGKDCCFAQCCPGGTCCASTAVCGACGGDECIIDETAFPAGAINPQSSCQTCNPFLSTTAWSLRRDFDLCGDDGKQFCCNGVCCAPGACCNDAGVCEIGGDRRCEKTCQIDGQSFPHSFINPVNPCQECSVFVSVTDWSPRLNIFPCGDGDEQVCCNGVCCAPGICCSSSFSGGICVPCP